MPSAVFAEATADSLLILAQEELKQQRGVNKTNTELNSAIEERLRQLQGMSPQIGGSLLRTTTNPTVNSHSVAGSWKPMAWCILWISGAVTRHISHPAVNLRCVGLVAWSTRLNRTEPEQPGCPAFYYYACSYLLTRTSSHSDVHAPIPKPRMTSDDFSDEEEGALIERLTAEAGLEVSIAGKKSQENISGSGIFFPHKLETGLQPD